MTQDKDFLRLLSIFHYILGAIVALFSLIPILYLAIGFAVLLAPNQFSERGGGPPEAVGWVMVILAGVLFLVVLTLAILMFFAGRNLARHRHYMFCLVIAGIECLFMPLGTALGVFTIIVLMRDSVKQLFVAHDGTAN